ncbi:hypothetical protein EDB80DRAFT_18861 [Ilyonectria destructans]|nr:hypothetical protein EDB80DRAFT_18861 [Ilyonectria destructans]
MWATRRAPRSYRSCWLVVVPYRSASLCLMQPPLTTSYLDLEDEARRGECTRVKGNGRHVRGRSDRLWHMPAYHNSRPTYLSPCVPVPSFFSLPSIPRPPSPHTSTKPAGTISQKFLHQHRHSANKRQHVARLSLHLTLWFSELDPSCSPHRSVILPPATKPTG